MQLCRHLGPRLYSDALPILEQGPPSSFHSGSCVCAHKGGVPWSPCKQAWLVDHHTEVLGVVSPPGSMQLVEVIPSLRQKLALRVVFLATTGPGCASLSGSDQVYVASRLALLWCVCLLGVALLL